jgi:hypothetical protein
MKYVRPGDNSLDWIWQNGRAFIRLLRESYKLQPMLIVAGIGEGPLKTGHSGYIKAG